MAVDHDRRSTSHDYQDYIDRAPSSDAGGWGVILGIAALLAILGMLFIGIGNAPTGTTPTTEPAIERTAPTPTPAPTPAPTPSPTPN